MSSRKSDPSPESASPAVPFVPHAKRIDPAWSAYWIRRTLTGESGKGMGSPFSDDDALLERI